jgi:5-oxoprolinase (ATP-hydrolysing) subunit A
MNVDATSLTNDVIYQIGALEAFARIAGSSVRYVKPHGALYNRTVSDDDQAAAVVAAVVAYDPTLPLLGLPGSALLRHAEQAGLRTVTEAFADRGYTAEATLVPRSQPGALLDDPTAVAERMVQMLLTGRMRSVDGVDISVSARSICVHGDSPGAVAMAVAVRKALAEAGVEIRSFAA